MFQLILVSDDEKNRVLRWKFTVYDKNEDGVLQRVEEYVFHEDLARLFGCSNFFLQLNELMDENNDHVISPQEWKGFFGVVTSGIQYICGNPLFDYYCQNLCT